MNSGGIPLSLYLKQIEQLIALQKVDDEIHAIRHELESAPREVEELRGRFSETTELRTRQIDKLEHLREQEKRLGFELEDDTARHRKSKSKLMQAGNTKEYHAVVREMDTLERMSRNREEERQALAEELARQTQLQQEIDERFAAVEEELSTRESSLEVRMIKAREGLDGLLLKRGNVAGDVPAPVFARYEFIRERLEHPVIVPVAGGICSGCNIAIPPQKFIELQKGTQILSCPNCQRLMFWTEHFTPRDQ
jgi:predicted  nucleic acid-binding Zn-ribbon protein